MGEGQLFVTPIEYQNRQKAQRNPQQGEHGADLPKKISCLLAIVPNCVVLIEDQSENQFPNGADDGT